MRGSSLIRERDDWEGMEVCDPPYANELYGSSRPVGVYLDTSSCGRIGVPNSPTRGVIGNVESHVPTGGVIDDESNVCSDVCLLCHPVIASLEAPKIPGLLSATLRKDTYIISMLLCPSRLGCVPSVDPAATVEPVRNGTQLLGLSRPLLVDVALYIACVRLRSELSLNATCLRLFFIRRRKKKMSATTAARARRPPTTPPAIAPTLLFLPPLPEPSLPLSLALPFPPSLPVPPNTFDPPLAVGDAPTASGLLVTRELRGPA